MWQQWIAIIIGVFFVLLGGLMLGGAIAAQFLPPDKMKEMSISI